MQGSAQSEVEPGARKRSRELDEREEPLCSAPKLEPGPAAPLQRQRGPGTTLSTLAGVGAARAAHSEHAGATAAAPAAGTAGGIGLGLSHQLGASEAGPTAATPNRTRGEYGAAYIGSAAEADALVQQLQRQRLRMESAGGRPGTEPGAQAARAGDQNVALATTTGGSAGAGEDGALESGEGVRWSAGCIDLT